MIEATNLSYSLPERYLFRGASFTIENGSHTVLIGCNGAGKTTLIDLLLHPDEYLFKGKVSLDGIRRVGYVNQFIEHEKDREISVYDYLCEDFDRMQARLDRLCEEFDHEEAADEYQRLLDEFTAIDGYDHEINVRKKLRTAGLEGISDVRLSDISGGEYKLVQIIRQMLLLPDILVMDEPDVFLDFDNLKGLRELINTYPGTLLTATHNRYLLNLCFDKVLQIENESVQEYDGSFIDFGFTQLRMKIAMQEMSIKESDFIAFEESVVERLRDDASKHPDLKKGKTLRARVSYLERWKARHVGMPYIEDRTPEISLPEVSEETDAEYAVKVTDYAVSFAQPLLEKVSFTVLPGEKAALVGSNGTGKTTLLRDIMNLSNPAVSVHPAMKTAFLSQFLGETLDETKSVWDYAQSLGFVSERDAARYLEKYRFDADILCHRISTLSGGEKNLLQLAGIALSGSGLLLLDEPTSHLDLRSQLALEKAVNAYRGTVIMVSHDFYCIAGCMDYVLLAEDNTIRKMSIRAFRKMIYKRHFDSGYLELEQKKKELELQIEAALRVSDYARAQAICTELERVTDALR